MNSIKIIVIILLISFILILLKKILFKKESFKSDPLDTIEINTQNDIIKRKMYFDKIDKTNKKANQELSRLTVENIDKDTLDTYIQSIIDSDKIATPNKLLVSDQEELPMLSGDTVKYNHKMIMLIASKKIKQDYLLKILKSKLQLLRNSLNEIDKLTN